MGKTAGEIYYDMEEYENRMQQWRDQGGDDIAAEYAELYEAAQQA